MNTVKVKCNNCQHEFDADEAWLGMTLPCPKCQSPTTVKIFQADAPLLKIVDEGECEKSPVSDTPTAFQILADLKDDELKKLHTLCISSLVSNQMPSWHNYTYLLYHTIYILSIF